MADNKWSVGDDGAWDPRTDVYIQMRSANGPYYDRSTQKVGTFVNGVFTPFANQTSAVQTYAPEIQGYQSAGPVGSAPQTTEQAAQALLETPDPSATPAPARVPEKVKISSGINASAAGILKYPKDNPITDKSDYISFQFYEYDPPFGRAFTGDGEVPQGTIQGSAGYQNYNTSAVGKKSAGLSNIILYMPEDIQAQYSQQWGGANFGAASAGLMNVAGTNLSALPDGLQSLSGLAKTAIFKTELDAINNITGADISLNQFMGGVSGTIVNPNTEMMYNGPTLRTFDLTFKLVPYSKPEAQEIRKICNTFKKAMLPDFNGQAIFGAFQSGNLITIPSVCQVTFMSGNNPHAYLPQYKLCSISDVAINYTPDGSYATLGEDDGGSPPVATQLRISFKEMKNIFASEINDDGPSY